MKTQLVRLLFRRRALLKRLLPVRRTMRVRLPLFDILVRLDDWAVGARIALKRSYEPYVTAVLQEQIKPGMVVIDVGANIGYYTLLAARLVGPTGMVVAFEPGPANTELIHRNLVLNQFTNVRILPVAVSDVPDMVGFGMDDSNGSITSGAQAQFQVPAVPLDQALAREPRIDLIKIDIEGAEGRALRGMARILTQHRPLVCCEFSPGRLPRISGVQPEEYLDSWRTHGYVLSVIPTTGPWLNRPYTNAEIMQYFASPSVRDHVDLIAWPQERM